MGSIKIRYVVLLTLMVLFTMSARSFAFEDTIKVGALLPMTGKLAQIGKNESRAFLMAVDEINSAGGINGKQINLIIENTGGDPDKAVQAINKLINRDNVIAIGGGCSSSATWKAIEIAQQEKVPFLVNTASADRITEQGWDYVFRINPPNSEYRSSLKSFVSSVGRNINTAAILFANVPTAEDRSEKLATFLTTIGHTVIAKKSFEVGSVDFMSLLVDLKEEKPDLICLISYISDAAHIMRQSEELNLNPKIFFTEGSGFVLGEFSGIAGNASAFVLSETMWIPSAPYPGAMEFSEKYKERYGSSAGYHGAQAYSGLMVLADALKRSTSPARETVRDRLSETDMMTPLGPVRFISYGNKSQQNELSIFLVQWLDGKLEIVWPLDRATKSYVYPAPSWRSR